MGREGAFFLYQSNVNTFNCHRRTDRRVEGWLRRNGWEAGEVWVDRWAEDWVGRWVGRGMGGWVGLQNLITDLDMRNGHKGGV